MAFVLVPLFVMISATVDYGLVIFVRGKYPGNQIEVSADNYSWGWFDPLLRSATPLQITAKSPDRMEGLPTGSRFHASLQVRALVVSAEEPV